MVREGLLIHPHIQGGFIWDWADQGLRQTLGDGSTRWAYGGDYGPDSYPHDKQFCINGLVFPDRTPHPGLAELKHVMRPVTATLVSWEVAAEKKSAIATVAVTTRYDTPPRAALRLEVSLAVAAAPRAADAPPRSWIGGGRLAADWQLDARRGALARTRALGELAVGARLARELRLDVVVEEEL